MHKNFILSFCKEIDKIAQQVGQIGSPTSSVGIGAGGGGSSRSMGGFRPPKPPTLPGVNPLRSRQGGPMSRITSKPKAQMARYASVEDLAEAIEKEASIEDLEKHAVFGAFLRGLGGLVARHPRLTLGGLGAGGIGLGAYSAVRGAKRKVEQIQAKRKTQIPPEVRHLYGR